MAGEHKIESTTNEACYLILIMHRIIIIIVVVIDDFYLIWRHLSETDVWSINQLICIW